MLTSRLPRRSHRRDGAEAAAHGSGGVPSANQIASVLPVADQVMADPSPPGPQPPSTPGDVLVLSGGGMFGAAQAGMLAALCEMTDWRPEAIVGVSAGALNGTWAAHDFTAGHLQGLVEIWEGFTGRGIFPARTVSQVLNVITRRDAVQDGAALKELIERCCPVGRLEDLSLPVHVAATDIAAGRSAWFCEGPAAQLLYASAALPGLVPPVSIDGVTYVDGGVTANVPVARAVELGARRVLCLDVSAGTNPGADPATALGVLLRSFSIALNSATDTIVDAASVNCEVWRVRPVLPAGMKVTDWSSCAHLVEAGFTTMAGWLAENGELLTPPPEPAVSPVVETPRRWRDRFTLRGAKLRRSVEV